MKTTKILAAFLLAAVLALVPLAVTAPPVQAASPAMPATGSALFPMTFHLSGTYTTSATAAIQFNAPFPMRLLYATVVVQAKGGTQGTSTIQVKHAGTAVTNAIDLTGTAGTNLEATLTAAQQSVAKDGTVTADLVITGGTSPTLSNVTVTLWYQRRN